MACSNKERNIIFSIDIDNTLGYNNELPYKSRFDMKRFKELTDNSIIVMGYNTWLSLPDRFKPLPNRYNIVITGRHFNDLNEQYRDEPNFIASSNWINVDNIILHNKDYDKVFIIGGKSLIENEIRYQHQYINNIYITLFETSINRYIKDKNNCVTIDESIIKFVMDNFNLLNEFSNQETVSILNNKVNGIYVHYSHYQQH